MAHPCACAPMYEGCAAVASSVNRRHPDMMRKPYRRSAWVVAPGWRGSEIRAEHGAECACACSLGSSAQPQVVARRQTTRDAGRGGLGADEGGNDLRKSFVLPHNRAAATCAPSQRSDLVRPSTPSDAKRIPL
eukprot:1860379-Prymnesium_polylepis.1